MVARPAHPLHLINLNRRRYMRRNESPGQALPMQVAAGWWALQVPRRHEYRRKDCNGEADRSGGTTGRQQSMAADTGAPIRKTRGALIGRPNKSNDHRCDTTGLLINAFRRNRAHGIRS